jgi:hypothetical protein
MANHDHWAGTNTYQVNIANSLDIVWGLYSNYDRYQYNDDAMYVHINILHNSLNVCIGYKVVGNCSSVQL